MRQLRRTVANYKKEDMRGGKMRKGQASEQTTIKAKKPEYLTIFSGNPFEFFRIVSSSLFRLLSTLLCLFSFKESA